MARRFVPVEDRPLAILSPRSLGAIFEIGERSREPFEIVGRYAVVSICGPLVQHGPSWWDNYDAIETRVRAALESPCEAVILRIDSPGGDAAGVFDLARALRAMATKKIVAFTDTVCASAAYAIACAADEIVISRTASVGSIGVFQPVLDVTAQDKVMGMRWEVIASGEAKTDGNPHVAIEDGAKARIKADVKQLAGLFFATVNELRGTPTEKLAELEGATRRGDRAVAEGLADRIATWAELTQDVAAASQTTEDNMDKEELRKALKAAAENEDGGWAQRALKAMDEEDEEKKDEEKKDEEKKDEEKKEAEAKALASSSGPQATLELLRRIHAMEAKDAAAERAQAVAKLLDSRPDFSAHVRKTLASLPVATVEDAVKNWPIAQGTQVPTAAATSAGGTAGKGQNVAPQEVEADDDDYIARRMGTSLASTGIKRNRSGRELELGVMTPAQAKAHLEQLQKGTV